MKQEGTTLTAADEEAVSDFSFSKRVKSRNSSKIIEAKKTERVEMIN